MKARAAFFLAASLVLGLGFTAAAVATPPNATSAVESPAQLATSCPTAIPMLDSLSSKFAPSSPLAMAVNCGPCSLNSCATIGSVCWYGSPTNGRWGSCQSPYGDSCPGTSAPKCQCWVGPLP